MTINIQVTADTYDKALDMLNYTVQTIKEQEEEIRKLVDPLGNIHAEFGKDSSYTVIKIGSHLI